MSTSSKKHRRSSRDDDYHRPSKKIKEQCLFKICIKYKYELNYVLKSRHQFIKNLDDFWSFFKKYERMQQRINTEYAENEKSNIESLICIKLNEKLDLLYDKIPLYDRDGDKVDIDFSNFKKFIDIVLFYLDFKQKEKFNILKKLRRDQAQLPIAEYRDEIIRTIHENRVVLIAGDTGCGKSTQVPQYVHKAGFTKIACTQPRRLACISLAKRVAYETLTENNATVAYQIRFEKTKRKGTNIIFITEGLLLRQTSDEQTLLSYDVIILDEVHERHLYGDFLIGIMKCLLYKNEKLKLILMSATININLFSEYFANENIKVIQVPGRLYPIEIIYKPIIKDKFEKKVQKFDPTPYLQVIQIIDEKYSSKERGDLLIFLSGLADITSLAEFITEYSKEKGNWIVLQLHSSLSLTEQDKVFDYPPEGVRKCIISTNIAETSVTIDGIRFVIDSGKVNKMSYSMTGGINKLKELTISQDSAKQRSGRAGRTGPGVCYRLYSENEFNQFEPFTTAEIHLVPLETLVLYMVSLGLTDVTNFPFLEKPEAVAIKNAIEKLKFYGAFLEDEVLTLTPLGEALSKLPVDLTIGKMLITSTIFSNITSVLCLAAIISIQSPYTNKAHRDLDCQNARKVHESDYGDPITLYNLFKEWLKVKKNFDPLEGSSKGKTENSKQWSRRRGLEEQRFYEVIKLISQFRTILQDTELLSKNPSKCSSSYERTMRYGELKQLRTMRKDLKSEMRSVTKKKLKFSINDDEEEENTEKWDLRDVEFRIHTDNNSLQELLNEISFKDSRNITILKLVLANGLYPQIAVADEYNYCKSAGEQFFHTKNKNYVSLHPMSYFSYNSAVLKLNEEDIEVPPAGYFSKNALSNKHQILVYQSLLETTKVYLMNTMRMPALQTLLLFSKKMCTNETITKITCDDFLMIDIPYVGQGKTILFKAVKLRKIWEDILTSKIHDPSSSDNIDDESRKLIDELCQYMHTKVSYTLKRLLKADLKVIYTFTTNISDLEALKINIFEPSYKAHKNHSVGGIQVTENLTYNCLVEDEWSMNIEQHISEVALSCMKCEQEIYGRFIDKIIHEETCKINIKDEEDSEKEKQDPESTLKYSCSECQKRFNTPLEVLKHKKTCKENK